MNVRNRVAELRNNPNVRGKYLNQIFPKDFIDGFSSMTYCFTRYRQCLNCAETVEQYGLEPDNISPRPFHTKCFNRMSVRITKKCFICKNILSQDKIKGQGHSPSDTYYRVCDSYCLDYYSIISCKIFGDDMTFLADELELQPLYTLHDLQKNEAYLKSRLPTPQLKAHPADYTVPPNHIFPMSKEINSYRTSEKEHVFFESGQMTIQEKGYYFAKKLEGYIAFMLHHELYFAVNESQRNMLLVQVQEQINKFNEIANHPPTERYMQNTGSYL